MLLRYQNDRVKKSDLKIAQGSVAKELAHTA